MSTGLGGSRRGARRLHVVCEHESLELSGGGMRGAGLRGGEEVPSPAASSEPWYGLRVRGKGARAGRPQGVEVSESSCLSSRSGSVG